jgi:hypothetical protein
MASDMMDIDVDEREANEFEWEYEYHENETEVGFSLCPLAQVLIDFEELLHRLGHSNRKKGHKHKCRHFCAYGPNKTKAT